MSNIKIMIADALRMLANEIESGRCHRSDEELLELYSFVADREVDRSGGAKIMGISVSYFDKLHKSRPDFPKPRKRVGFKPVWSIVELKNFKKVLHK